MPLGPLTSTFSVSLHPWSNNGPVGFGGALHLQHTHTHTHTRSTTGTHNAQTATASPPGGLALARPGPPSPVRACQGEVAAPDWVDGRAQVPAADAAHHTKRQRRRGEDVRLLYSKYSKYSTCCVRQPRGRHLLCFWRQRVRTLVHSIAQPALLGPVQAISQRGGLYERGGSERRDGLRVPDGSALGQTFVSEGVVAPVRP